MTKLLRRGDAPTLNASSLPLASLGLGALLAACGSAEEPTAAVEHGLLAEFEGTLDPATGAMSIAAVSAAGRGLTELKVVADGVTGAGPKNTIELETRRVATGLACGGTDTTELCAEVRLRSFFPEHRLDGVWIELLSLTPATAIEGKSDLGAPKGLVTRYGAWKYGDVAASGSVDGMWRFRQLAAQNFRFKGRVRAVAIVPMPPQLTLIAQGASIAAEITPPAGAVAEYTCAAGTTCIFDVPTGSDVALESDQPASRRWAEATGPFACEDLRIDGELSTRRYVRCTLSGFAADTTQTIAWNAPPAPPADRALTVTAIGEEVAVYEYRADGTDGVAGCAAGQTCVIPFTRGSFLDVYATSPGHTFQSSWAGAHFDCGEVPPDPEFGGTPYVNCTIADAQLDLELAIEWAQDPSLNDPEPDPDPNPNPVQGPVCNASPCVTVTSLDTETVVIETTVGGAQIRHVCPVGQICGYSYTAGSRIDIESDPPGFYYLGGGYPTDGIYCGLVPACDGHPNHYVSCTAQNATGDISATIDWHADDLEQCARGMSWCYEIINYDCHYWDWL